MQNNLMHQILPSRLGISLRRPNRAAATGQPPTRGNRANKLILVVLAAILLSACGQLSLTAETHYQRGLELQAQGDRRAALIEFKNALQKNPGHAEARLGLGSLSLELGDLATARAELQRASELGIDRERVVPILARIWLLEGAYDRVLERVDPADFEPGHAVAQALLLRGEALSGLGRASEAMETFEAALEAAPELHLVRVAIARLLMIEQQPGEARSQLREALENAPEMHQAWALLGELEVAEARLEEADAAFGEAIKYSPVPHNMHLQRALTRFVLQDVAGMEQDHAALRQAVPGSPAGAYVEGLVLYLKAQHTDAQSAFEQALGLEPKLYPAMFFLGASHLAQENWRLAEQHLAQFLTVFPESVPARVALAQARMGAGDLETSASLLQVALVGSPDDAMTLQMLGNLYRMRGESDLAVAHLRQLAMLRPDDPAARAALAQGLLEAGDREEGLRELEKAIAQAPGQEDLEAMFILNLIQGSEFDAALEAASGWIARAPQNTVPYNLKAAALVGKGDLGRARAVLLEALAIAPGHPDVSNNLAQILVQMGAVDDARQVLRDSLQRNPGDVTVSLRLAAIEFNADNVDTARALLEQSIQRNPNALEPRLALGREHLNRGEPRRALSVLEPVIESSANDPEVLNVLGQAQVASGQRAQAVTTFRKLSEGLPESAEARYRLGVQFERAGSPRDALREYGRALEIEATHAEALQARATLELGEGRADQALALARRLQEQEQHFAARGHAIEGSVHGNAGRDQEALDSFKRAYELDASTDNVVALASAHQKSGGTDQASSLLAEHLAEHPDDVRVRFRLAEALMNSGENSAAISHYEELVGMFPDNVLVLNNLGYLYQAESDPRALDYAERAYALRPNHPAVASTLGWILVNRDELDRGLTLLEAARRGLPEDVEVRYHYATALAKAGRPDEAREELVTLLNEVESFPQRADAEALLGTLR